MRALLCLAIALCSGAMGQASENQDPTPPGLSPIPADARGRARYRLERNPQVELMELGRNPWGVLELAVAKDETVVLIAIPGGAFTLGSAHGDGSDDEKPATDVTLSPYWIGKHEITWAQYGRFCSATQRPLPDRPSWAEDDHPVVNVTHNDAVAYATWLGLWNSPERPGLPTEAQWEFAARGSDSRKWPWGSTSPDQEPPLSNLTGAVDGFPHTAPVGSYPNGAGPFGALDQAGNAGEWCADWFAPYPGGRLTNPTGPATGSLRVHRGGSWALVPPLLRTTSRGWRVPSGRLDSLGFRVALDLTR